MIHFVTLQRDKSTLFIKEKRPWLVFLHMSAYTEQPEKNIQMMNKWIIYIYIYCAV